MNILLTGVWRHTYLHEIMLYAYYIYSSIKYVYTDIHHVHKQMHTASKTIRTDAMHWLPRNRIIHTQNIYSGKKRSEANPE